MSNRNPKRPAPKASTKAARARQESISSTTTFDYASANSFSDDNYSAVDDIDDEEEDEEDVVAVEEQAIADEPSPASTPRPAVDDDPNDGDDESDDTSSLSSGDISWPGLPDESPMDIAQFDAAMEASHGIEENRRVRFAVPSDESDSSTDDENVLLFPDLFVDQALLDPSFRHTIEHQDDNSSISESFWDYETPVFTHPPPMQISEDQPFDPVPDQQLHTPGCEIDPEISDGETTEDEDYPDGPIKPPTTEPHQQDDNSDSEFDAPVRHSKDQPLTTAFSLSKRRNKPIAVYNTKTKKMMFFTQDGFDPATEQAVQQAVQQFQGSFTEPSSPLKNGDLSLNTGTEPFFRQSATFGSFFEPSHPDMEDVLGVLRRYPHQDYDADEFNGVDPYSEPDWAAMDWAYREPNSDASSTSAASEEGLDLGAFIDMGEPSDDDAHKEPASTPVRPVTASSDADVLGHLHSSNVGAFRQNQANARLSSYGISQDAIDFSGPYQNTTIRGFKSDRFDTASTPLTPARVKKRRVSDVARSPLDAASNKRKASAEDASDKGHKKQKSISTELTDLHM